MKIRHVSVYHYYKKSRLNKFIINFLFFIMLKYFSLFNEIHLISFFKEYLERKLKKVDKECREMILKIGTKVYLK